MVVIETKDATLAAAKLSPSTSDVASISAGGVGTKFNQSIVPQNDSFYSEYERAQSSLTVQVCIHCVLSCQIQILKSNSLRPCSDVRFHVVSEPFSLRIGHDSHWFRNFSGQEMEQFCSNEDHVHTLRFHSVPKRNKAFLFG